MSGYNYSPLERGLWGVFGHVPIASKIIEIKRIERWENQQDF
jgi:hypothetical protein